MSASTLVRIALVQLRCESSEPLASRVERAHELVREAAGRAEFVVLPELWHSGAFDLAGARAAAEPIDGPLITGLRTLAAELGIWLHGGSFTEVDHHDHYNTSVLIDPRGELVVTYRKIHLFGFADGERTLMSSGDELVVVDTPLGPTGLATCYDLRFPELFRALTEGGATCFVVTSGWPASRIEHWDVLTRARAIEDQCWLIACNEVGEQPGVSLGGHSIVVDPRGVVIAQAGDGEEILYAEIDPAEPERWRAAFPALADIRVR